MKTDTRYDQTAEKISSKQKRYIEHSWRWRHHKKTDEVALHLLQWSNLLHQQCRQSWTSMCICLLQKEDIWTNAWQTTSWKLSPHIWLHIHLTVLMMSCKTVEDIHSTLFWLSVKSNETTHFIQLTKLNIDIINIISHHHHELHTDLIIKQEESQQSFNYYW